MATQNGIPPIMDVVRLLGLQIDPRSDARNSKYKVRCPFCGFERGKKVSYHMDVDAINNVYHCYKCGCEKGTGVLDLYSRVRFGKRYQGERETRERLKEELGNGWVRSQAPQKTTPRQEDTVQTLPDWMLDKAYSFILAMPEFGLSEQHRAKLKARGLDDAAIIRNGYATIPEDMSWVLNYPVACEAAEKLEATKKQYRQTRGMSSLQLAAGIVVAEKLNEAGIKIQGVPGSCKLGGYWMFILWSGMLIPTRNRVGKIVALQTRTDKGSLRYITMSAGGLPGAVGKGVARTHFPLGNAKLAENIPVLVTEGPLKADVAVHLMGQPSFIMAIHGVNNTKELTGIFRYLHASGVRNVWNAFDMDKVCNTNVRSASKRLAGMAHGAGLKMSQLCWDADTARKIKSALLSQYPELTAIATKNDVFASLAAIVDVAKGKGIGFPYEEYWDPKTKGIDDFLLNNKPSAG